MAKKEQINLLSSEELQERLSRLDRELFLLRDEWALQKKLDKPHLLREKRRQKARLLTLLTQRKGSGVEAR